MFNAHDVCIQNKNTKKKNTKKTHCFPRCNTLPRCWHKGLWFSWTLSTGPTQSELTPTDAPLRPCNEASKRILKQTSGMSSLYQRGSGVQLELHAPCWPWQPYLLLTILNGGLHVRSEEPHLVVR